MDKHGLSEDTLVMVVSEQGSGFPFAKWTCYDNGLQSAMVVRWPEKIKAGSKTSAMVEYVDVLPTFLEAAGKNIPDEIIVDLAGTDIGTSIKISSVKLGNDVVPTITDRDFVIATVASPTVIKEPEKPAEGEAAAEGAEGEAPAEGAEATPKDGEAAKKDDKAKEGGDKKKEGGDKKPEEKKPAEKK